MKNIGDHVYNSSPYVKWRGGPRCFSDVYMNHTKEVLKNSARQSICTYVSRSIMIVAGQSLRDSIRTSIKNKL